MNNFQNEATVFYFVLFYLKHLIGATNKPGPEKYSTIPFGILGPSKFTESVMDLSFSILKICLAVPSGSRYYLMIDQDCAYRFRPSPEWEEVGVNFKSKKF